MLKLPASAASSAPNQELGTIRVFVSSVFGVSVVNEGVQEGTGT